MSKIMINSVLLKNNIESISNENYLEIKKRSNYEYKRLYNSSSLAHNSFDYRKEGRAYEIIKSVKNNDLNTIEKLMFISNMIIPDDEKFANNLLTKKYTKEKLEEINNLLSVIKRLPKSEQDKVLNCELFIEYSYFAKLYYGINNPHILINKSNEILVKHPELLLKK